MKNPAFGKSIWTLLMVFTTVSVFDMFFNLTLKKTLHLPISAMTSSIGIILIVYSDQWYNFLILAFLVPFSKYFLRQSKLHIYNPNNFAMVFAFIFLSSEVTTTGGRWNFDTTMFTMMISVGLLISYFAKRILVSLSYIASFFVIAYFRSVLLDIPFQFALLPYSSPTFYLFSFYHITDPITTPSNEKGMIFFGFLLALLDNFLRSFDLLYTPFFAYFILASIQPYFKTIFQRPYDREKLNNHLVPAQAW